MTTEEAVANAVQNMADIEAAKPTMQEAGQGLMILGSALKSSGEQEPQPYKIPVLGHQWKDGKVHPVRRMDWTEWALTIMACLGFEIIPVMLTISTWQAYGPFFGLCAACFPLAVLCWEIKVIRDREVKGE